MTATSINHRLTHRPTPFIAAAAAVVALVAGSVAVSVAHDRSDPSAPGQQPQTSVQQDTPKAHHFHYTTSGGRVMPGN